jgi:prevent-host-death family protein
MNEHSRIWLLQEAKAKLSEVVKRAMAEGPQRVTLHVKAAVKIVLDDEDNLVGDGATGASLIELLNISPLRMLGEGDFNRSSMKASNRKIEL